MALENPLNLLLIPPILFLIYRIFVPAHAPPSPVASSYTGEPESYNWLPPKHPEVICLRKYTAKDLAQFDGVKGGKIMLAIQRTKPGGKIDLAEERTVFDVTLGKQFYGPDGMYGNFAGRDASRGMAKQSFELDTLTPIDQPLDTLSDLTTAEIENMRGWHEHFERKYIVVGELVNE
ncbi:hypothetical protein IAT38_007267 [Cryptococcus sp. DSM 104549]